MNWNAVWIQPEYDMGDIVPVYTKQFSLPKIPVRAVLHITALGVYEAHLNGKRIGNFVLAPGWTSYYSRLQYQSYDITADLAEQNTITVTVGKGWYRSPMPGWCDSSYQDGLRSWPAGLLAELEITYEDGTSETIGTDTSWSVAESATRFSEIYDGEQYNASKDFSAARCRVHALEGPWDSLIPQEGAEIHEQERISPSGIFTTPAGETVVDFGQELTGYVELSVDAKCGNVIALSHAEVMDRDGNFYTENYRAAKAKLHYTCCDGRQTWHPHFTFFGFRYIRIDAFPGGAALAKPENFTAIVVHSEMKRTGHLSCSDPLLNRLFSNIIWGQKGNFVDVPTDCPQRDERLGWTGDAQVFVRTACMNYDAEQFFTKWLADMAADQRDDGCVGHVIPDLLQAPYGSAAWGDAAVICPWEVYLAYGNPQILKNQFDCMKGWIDYITGSTKTPYLWTGGTHYGDWLGLDAPSGSYKGSTREDFIASAFYAHSTELLIKAGHVLGKDMADYEALYEKIIAAFRAAFPTYGTQSECVLAAHFHLTEHPQSAADQLAKMVKEAGNQLQIGFVGTPYLLHVLSDYGYAELAYTLLLRKEYPSWLYPVTKGATTIWEHWDGIMENGGFWSADMNSFNHYAYGSVADWVYQKAAGIHTAEDAPGYAFIRFAPVPDARLSWLTASLQTRHGLVESGWRQEDGKWRYEITTPVDAEICIDKNTQKVAAGHYIFYSQM
ncbi:MAG: family 78 glycoside hydrolase catalytic domain [Lachnospiraceae bacterium]